MNIYSRGNPPTGFYVYAYITPSTGLPYYIGKGKGQRAIAKHRVSVPTDHKHIIIIESHLTELGAWAIERRLIEWHGRKDLGTGLLENKHEGGPGNSTPAGSVGPTSGKFWVNDGKKNRLCNVCPPGFVLGRLTKSTKGKHWYNNGITSIMSETCPAGWSIGVLPSHAANSGRTGVYWWNNGTEQVKSPICPAGWQSGPLPGFGKREGRKWYHNGEKESAYHADPGPGWIVGRLPKQPSTNQ